MSDDFDDFGDDFSGVDFAQIDQTVSNLLPPASQQPRKPTIEPPRPTRVTEKYHHTVSKPAKLLQPRTSLTKDPGPINTEPRAAGAGSGFGWNVDGGKRSYDGNLERHIGDERRRNDEWRNRQVVPEEEDFPEVVLRKEGGYGLGPSEAGINNGVPPPASQNTSAAGAAARRQAMISASRSNSTEPANAVAGPSRLPQQQVFKQPQERPIIPAKDQFAPRTLARSTSAGHQPQPPRPLSRNGVSHLPVIHSQSQTSTNSQQPPASQGSLVRKTAIELEEEKRKREIAEEEIKLLKAEVERIRLESSKAVKVVVNGHSNVTETGIDAGKEMERLKKELWAALGEGNNIRRMQKEVSSNPAGMVVELDTG
jgi:hypothetical protein